MHADRWLQRFGRSISATPIRVGRASRTHTDLLRDPAPASIGRQQQNISDDYSTESGPESVACNAGDGPRKSGQTSGENDEHQTDTGCV
jgi:hypothetical protein